MTFSITDTGPPRQNPWAEAAAELLQELWQELVKLVMRLAHELLDSNKNPSQGSSGLPVGHDHATKKGEKSMVDAIPPSVLNAYCYQIANNAVQEMNKEYEAQKEQNEEINPPDNS